MLRKLISGGQTGADRAGLDFAIEAGLEHGGFVPRGRRAEDGKIPEQYHLAELSSISYSARTKRNAGQERLEVIVSVPVAAFSQVNQAQFYVSMTRGADAQAVVETASPAGGTRQ